MAEAQNSVQERPFKDRLDYLDERDRYLIASISREHREALMTAHEALIGKPVDVEQLAHDVNVRVHYQEMPAGIYGSLRGYAGGMYDIRIRAGDVMPRKRFTLAHELAHFFLHVKDWKDGEINLQEDIFLRSDRTSQKHEWEANALAAHILMPVSKIRRLEVEQPKATVRQAAGVFGVSHAAMVVRLGLPVG